MTPIHDDESRVPTAALQANALRALAVLLDHADEPLPFELGEAIVEELEWRIEKAKRARALRLVPAARRSA